MREHSNAIRHQYQVGIPSPSNSTSNCEQGTVIKTGYYYGKNCVKPCFVPVPIDAGIKTAMCVDDFASRLWVVMLGGKQVQRLSLSRVVVHEFPFSSGVLLPHPFTIYYNRQIPQIESDINQNQPLQHPRLGGLLWYGHILVLRHGTSEPVVAVRPWDRETINAIVIRYVISYFGVLMLNSVC